MAYKWKPSKTARREFAQKMQNDSDFAAAYYQRKEEKAEKRRAGSSYDYATAGGRYVPTREQHDFCLQNMHLAETSEQQDAFNQVLYGYSCQEKIHHDYIHVVNEIRRANPNL